MCGENKEKPSPDANPTEKARWSLCKALMGKPEGMTREELNPKVQEEWPGEFVDGFNRNRIGGALNSMQKQGLVERTSDGRWRCTDVPESLDPPQEGEAPVSKTEAGKYPLVKDQLVSRGECARAEVVGGSLGKGEWRWGTPDVVGVIVPNPTAMQYGFHQKILAVEVKDAIDSDSLFTGFGQASAYLDFAHAAFLVVPQCQGGVIDRIKRLCWKSGVGLAFIVSEDGEELLEIRISPRPQEPDPKQLQKFLDRLEARGISP